MTPIYLKVARIGNSRGVRIPAPTLKRYHLGDSVVMEERAEGILLRAHGSPTAKLSWEDTAKAIAGENEDWNAWDVSSADGLDELPWAESAVQRVAESHREYAAKPRPRKKAAKR